MTAHSRRRAIPDREIREIRSPRPGDRSAAAALPLRAAAPPRRTVQQLVLLIADVIALWRERARSRKQLLRLDDALLKDIGITRADVERETMKPFWR